MILSIIMYNYLIINVFCDPIWTRTRNLLLRRQLLYPIELWDPLQQRATKIKYIASKTKWITPLTVKIKLKT